MTFPYPPKYVRTVCVWVCGVCVSSVKDYLFSFEYDTHLHK